MRSADALGLCYGSPYIWFISFPYNNLVESHMVSHCVAVDHNPSSVYVKAVFVFRGPGYGSD